MKNKLTVILVIFVFLSLKAFAQPYTPPKDCPNNIEIKQQSESILNAAVGDQFTFENKKFVVTSISKKKSPAEEFYIVATVPSQGMKGCFYTISTNGTNPYEVTFGFTSLTKDKN